MTGRPNIYFESAGEPYSADPAAPSQISRGAAGSQFKSAFPDPSRTFLKRGKFAQAVIDIVCIGFGVAFAIVSALAIVGSIFCLLFLRL